MTALFKIGYGLYVVTSNDGTRDNGLIVNTVTQLTDQPFRVAVNINKANYSHHIIKKTGILNVNCLSVDAPFRVFQNFGFQSGRQADKFAGWKTCRSGISAQVYQCVYVSEGRAVCGFGYPRHVYLYSDRGPCYE